MAAKKKPNTKASNKDVRQKPYKDTDPAVALAADVERQKAIKMRLEGYTFREIAAQLEIAVSTAHSYVNDGWERVNNATDEDRTVLRDIELARLDAMLKRVLPIATANNLQVEKEVFLDGERVVVTEEDAELQFKAVDRALKIGKRRADLLGLDAPVRVEVAKKRKTVPLEELLRLQAERKAAKQTPP